MIEKDILVTQDSHSMRLDKFIMTEVPDITRSRIKILIESGQILVNDKIVKCGYSMRAGDTVGVNIAPPVELSLEPCDIPLEIVYEDEHLAVVNKPRGMVTHPAMGSPNGTLVNALLYQLDSLSDINGVIRPGIVHRLDKDTSGLMVVAKNNKAHLSLSEQIATKTCRRTYVALVDGVIKKESGEIIGNLERSRKDRKLMTIVSEGGRFAETHFRVLERYRGYCLVEYELKTGRTHQIRVHSRHIGHTIVGDVPYGGSVKLFKGGQLLHAYKLSFDHPATGERLEFNSEPPECFNKVLVLLRSKI